MAIWKPNHDGAFSCSSAWELIRKKKDKTRSNTLIWHKYIPFEVSFLLWRAIRGKLPTNERISMFGADPVSCSCCNRPGLDTIDHIFVDGHFANSIWTYIVVSLGIAHTKIPLRSVLIKWWGLEYKNEVHKHLILATPIFISWNL